MKKQLTIHLSTHCNDPWF